jgi:predicted RND superfamily exporter protein
MIMNLLTGLSLELIVIGAVISLVLRSFKLGAISLPSNVFPLLATAAALVMFGWPLQYASVLAFNICLGIAVDDTVHFLSRFKRELAATGDRQRAVRNSFRAVGPVMVTQTILMISGFGAGLFCTIPTIRAFSACSCIALLLALASEMLIMPALLLCLPRIGKQTENFEAIALGNRTETTCTETTCTETTPVQEGALTAAPS